ncbi:GAF domain-containing protein [Pseudomonas sp. HR96]|uniref:GAF domain-containing protein n=1 Tax=Pseudomonas sp. HR96 TaxID=1027966 RepID=UPI002A749AC0|nr:GAF domain-containing protein [Pseudomonas sp. HR96]WPP01468.1 GAF domain-containing protein [Pseudomonas sp. HR96]
MAVSPHSVPEAFVVPTVTLANCEDEPIHQPGGIQPHGALVALDPSGRVLTRSANFAEHLGFDAQPGSRLSAQDIGDGVMHMLNEGLAADSTWVDSAQLHKGGTLFDVVAHRHQALLYLEFEPRQSSNASFSQVALYAQRIISQMQRRHDIDSLLARVTEEIRHLTGYDRVMAYRFRPDLSGEVIAEARRPDLETYMGQRYPASDIPAQARLLYILNPTRLIADVSYEASRLLPALNPLDGQPFDLSFSVLRSVSPIHCEYLTNMGVKASMSVSIVVEGKLWGLFSCHHMSPKTIAHPLRISFQVISQLCSALVERLEHNQSTLTLHNASLAQQSISRAARDSEDLLAALTAGAVNITTLLPCDGAAVALAGRIQSLDGEFDDLARSIMERLEVDPDLELYHTEQWAHTDASSPDTQYCGVLAVRFHRQEGGWVFWFRREEISHVRWAGKPDKILKVGPSGPRLTPRGSFEAWEEVVKGRSPAWGRTDLTIAEKLRGELVELSLTRAGEVDGMRQRLIAMLGHDLRNPLQSISMAASMLSSSETRDTELRRRISHSSGRMERLISQVLEMSRLQSGLSILVQRIESDLSGLVQSIVDETCLAFPGLVIEADIAPGVNALIDPDRYAQVITNLLGNALHHGTPGTSVRLKLRAEPQASRLAISNQTAPLAPEQVANLFLPFKAQPVSNPRNRGSLGIGLYISQAIAAAHQGRIEVQQADGLITFSLVIPSSGG